MGSLGIYLHIPFCVRKCAYCDFLSSPAKEKDRLCYAKALEQEIRSMRKLASGYQADTVFFGGGTPSILEPELVEGLLEALYETFSFAKAGTEISLEANPGTLTKEKLERYQKCGINRLSLGLQSANNRELKRLGRIHTWEDFLENYRMARNVGFENINVDVMSALPGQTMEGWQDTLEKVLALQPEHISAYSLIVEEGTPFYATWEKGELLLPDEETERRIYERTRELLEAEGYHRYEISNYARYGFECRHNNKYWIGEDYLGLGLGASSYIGGCRMKNTACLDEYIKKAKEGDSLLVEQQLLSKKEKMEEFMFLGLRRMEGIRKNQFLERFGEELSGVYGEIIEKQQSQGLLWQDRERLWLTKRGIDVSNVALAEYLL